MSYRSVDEFEDDDPTEELPMLQGHMLKPDEDTRSADSICAENQEFESESLDAELREANDRVSELSSELSSRTETMKSVQCELDRLRERSESLEEEVESGKGAISDVTDELGMVRTQQNDANEQLRRRQQQITALQNKLANKDAFIDKLARRVDFADAPDEQDLVDSQEVHGDFQTGCADASGHAQLNRLRMLVARHDKNSTTYPVLADGVSVGTSPENDIQLEDAFVSYRHARITETSTGCLLKDLDSSNGTWINQRRIKWQLLRDGDLIDFGPLRFEFIDKLVEIGNAQIEDEAS